MVARIGRFNNLGGTQLLFWHAIQEAKKAQLSEFDMGRSDCDNSGLVTFKDRWGAANTDLAYFRYPMGRLDRGSDTRKAFISTHVWSHAPGVVLAAAGKVLYKYWG